MKTTRFLVLLCILSVISLAGLPSQAAAQGVPGKNVSLVGPTPRAEACATPPYCGGLVPDVGLKQQNEPSCAFSPETGNLMCGANDYRGVDRADGVLGDAWMGAYMSRDGGLTWVSRLVPGFRGGGANSLGLSYGADPIVLPFPGGMLYVFIAGNRGENAPGGVYAQQWVEVSKEDGYPFVPANGAPKTIATGTSGRFLDKPGAMLNMLGSGTCDIPYQRADGTPGLRTVPAFEVSVGYATFLGSDNSDGTSVWIVKSTDCGATWDRPGKKLTQSLNINQGLSLAALGNRYVATWRTFTDSNQPESAIQYSASTNRGQTWSKPELLATILPFDQGTSSVTFRTTALPWAVADGSAFHVFWAERRSAADPLSRIRVSSSTNGNTWSAPATVDNAPSGHQFIPSAASANGVTQIAWYDTRDDHVQTFTQFINDFRDQNGKIQRHTADIRAAQATWNGTALVFSPSVKVSSYRTGLAPAGFLGPGSAAQVVKLEDNFVNSRIFKQGMVPFLGDYIAVTAKTLRWDGSAWVPNTAPNGQAPSFFLAWTDNRSLRGNTVADLVEATGYTPPSLSSFQGEEDPTTPHQPCTGAVNLPNTRNQEVFGAMIRPGLIVSVPSAPKPTGTIQRAFVVHLTNTTSQARIYRVRIATQPPDAAPTGTGRASFLQSSLVLPVPESELNKCISVPRRSGGAVTVFVSSTSASPSVRVDVSEADASCQVVSGVSASVSLNADPRAPDIENPDFENPDFENFDLLATEIHNPDIENKTVSFLTIANPDIENPDFENYTPAFPDIENPDFENPDFENFTVKYPDIENPDIENPDFENAALAAGGITEVTWSVKMVGNTTSALDVRALFSRLPTTFTQLIVRRVYATPTAQSCGLVQIATNQVVVNTVTPGGQRPEGSFFLAPGETALITIRMPGTVNPATVGVNTTAQASNTGSSTPFEEDPPSADATPPVLTLPGPTSVEATGPGGALVTYTATATDETAGSVTVQCSPASGSVFPVGSTAVACSATDGVNTVTGTFDITVTDSSGPTFGSVPANLVVGATSPAGAVVTFASPTAIDVVDGPVAATCSPASGSTFPIGTTPVTCTATDSHGNATSASFTVTIADTIAPTVGPHANLVAEATTLSGAVVLYANPTAADNIAVVSLTCAPASGAVFPFGSTTVTCTARDAAGNTGIGTFTVAVADTTAPIIAPHAPVVAIAPTTTGATVTYGLPTATDLGASVPVVCGPVSGSAFPLGTTTVQCTASDGRGNAAASSFTVTVQFGFVGLLTPWRPGPPTYTVNVGSSVPVNWRYVNASGALVDTSAARPTVTFTLLQSCSGGSETSTVFVNQASPGNSFFNYSGGSWQFNWQTKAPVVAGCYNIRVSLDTTGQVNGPFLIRLR